MFTCSSPAIDERAISGMLHPINDASIMYLLASHYYFNFTNQLKSVSPVPTGIRLSEGDGERVSEHADYIVAEAVSVDAVTASCLKKESGNKNVAAGSCCAGPFVLHPLANAMSPYTKRKIKPGPDVQHDEAMLEYCNDYSATIFHPSGTCRVGTDDVHPCTAGPLT